jgi:hypothetical protein
MCVNGHFLPSRLQPGPTGYDLLRGETVPAPAMPKGTCRGRLRVKLRPLVQPEKAENAPDHFDPYQISVDAYFIAEIVSGNRVFEKKKGG